MRFAILADIHANLEALQAVLADAKAQRCEQFACLGDYVGYGADPKACLDLIRSLKAPCVKGNCDEHVVEMPTGLNPKASNFLRWTTAQLAEDDRRWLRELPYIRELEHFTIVHANLNEPHKWGYVFDKNAAASSFTHQTAPLCFYGHTHVPIAFTRDAQIHGGTYTKFTLKISKSYFVNPGSVGQPRDGNPLASYAICDSAAPSIELRRIPFDLETAREKIRSTGF